MESENAEQQPHASILEQLRHAEHLWAWKFGLRVMVMVLDIIGIGCAGWLLSTTFDNSNFGISVYNDGWVLPWPLITVILLAAPQYDSNSNCTLYTYSSLYHSYGVLLSYWC